jgi:hypothetical protein
MPLYHRYFDCALAEGNFQQKELSGAEGVERSRMNIDNVPKLSRSMTKRRAKAAEIVE